MTPEGRLKIFAASTRMMCLEEKLSRLEDAFQRLTTAGAFVTLGPDGRLTLAGEGHILVFRLRDYVE